MPRYFSRPRGFWVEDDVYVRPADLSLPIVPEHEATDTGLLDGNGNPIWRAANPMGFGKDRDW